MLLIYSLMNRDLVFAQDSTFSHISSNAKTVYKYQKWEEYGYLDYVTYADYINDLNLQGKLSDEEKEEAINLGRSADKDSETVRQYVEEFTDYYQSRGYHVTRLDAVQIGRKVIDGGKQQLFAYRDENIFKRAWEYFKGVLQADDKNYARNVEGKRGLIFTLHDPLYNGKFSPAIMGNGTKHRYLLYFDNKLPFIHQNIITLNLGTSYSVNKGVDVWTTMTQSQGNFDQRMLTYPTGLEEMSADNLHSASYLEGSKDKILTNRDRFTDDYTVVETYKSNHSMMGFSFIIGIIAVALSYIIAIPLGVLMARHKDKLVDQIGTAYIVFILAVPSLAYIFLFKAIGGAMGLPTSFDLGTNRWTMYVLPIISLALPSVANLMKWLRRFMIDQMNSDYVKFARSGGLTENEIFRNHILKNAAIPIIHGIPASVLGALTGAIITERVYVVPGAGNLLTVAINKYDNGVIVGVTLFYAVLSIVSIILGDILMATVDPRISFTDKRR